MRKAEGTVPVAPLRIWPLFFALVVRLLSREKLLVMMDDGRQLPLLDPVNGKIEIFSNQGIIRSAAAAAFINLRPDPRDDRSFCDVFFWPSFGD